MGNNDKDYGVTNFPGFKKGHTKRNYAVAILYIIIFLFSSYWIHIIPLIAAILLRYNVFNARDIVSNTFLGKLPFLTSGGRKTSVSAVIYGYIWSFGFFLVITLTLGAIIFPALGVELEENGPPINFETPRDQIEYIADNNTISDFNRVKEIKIKKSKNNSRNITVHIDVDQYEAYPKLPDHNVIRHIKQISLNTTRELYQSNLNVTKTMIITYIEIRKDNGNWENVIASKVGVTRETAENINWDKVNTSNLREKVDLFKMHMENIEKGHELNAPNNYHSSFLSFL